MKPALATVLDVQPEGILHCSLPTPFPVGDVNCWLLPERPVTLIDAGMFIPHSMHMVEDFLAAAGLKVRDIDQIVVTHSHPDHYGAAAWLAERASAPIIAGRPELYRLLPFPSEYRTVARRVLRDLDIPDDVRDAFAAGIMAVRQLIQPPAREQLELVDDHDRIEAGGRTFELHLTPGHSVGHISLFDGEVLFSGDHLLPRITPNPMLELDDTGLDWQAIVDQAADPDAGPLQRRQSLVEYLDSLQRFAEIDPDAVLPGHDVPFTGVPDLVANLREHHRARVEEIAGLLATLGSPTAYELAKAMFPELEGMGIMLAVSEVLGHVDVLIAEGRVLELPETPIRFGPTHV